MWYLFTREKGVGTKGRPKYTFDEEIVVPLRP